MLTIAEIDTAAELIAASHAVVALTGAGVSTRSGIPDFRSPGTGLWELRGEPPPDSIHRFAQAPERFYAWLRPLLQTILPAEPNPAHRALAELEELGCLQAIITQNADGLHQRAGSAHVIEIHGTLETATCIRCYRPAAGLSVLEQYLRDGEVPRCEVCNGVMKPNVILMGEQLPFRAVQAARAALRGCDRLVIAGTSLALLSTTQFVAPALQAGACMVLINETPTPLDEQAEVVIRSDVVEALPALVRAVRRWQGL